MKKTFPIFIFFLLAYSFCYAQNDCWIQSWKPEMDNWVFKHDGNYRYYFDLQTEVKVRNQIIDRSKEYIKDNLKIINEPAFDDKIIFMFVRDLEEMYKYAGVRVAGTIYTAEQTRDKHTVFCLFENGNVTPLKHELMHLITAIKWGRIAGGLPLAWLGEGLATYADPNVLCDGYSFEEKYIAFLQKNKLVKMDSLIIDFHGNPNDENFDYKRLLISYNQSAYMVQYMIEKYGVEKVKDLWQSGMNDFERIFGLNIEDMISDIERQLKAKYPNPIPFDWDKFQKKCY